MARNPDSAASKIYQGVARRLAAIVSMVSFESANPLKPKEIVEGDEELRIVWSDDTESHYSFEDLRRNCPCAKCVDEWTGRRKEASLSLPASLRLLDVNAVGNYAIQLFWSDGHNTGIYSFNRLKELAAGGMGKPG